jgi:hypothetical protein
MNKGATKIKAIAKRALEIREKGGFKTETITKKHYNMPYIPNAIKQAAEELRDKKEALKVKSYKIIRIVKPGTGRVFFYPVNENGQRLTKTNFARKYDAENLGRWYVEKCEPKVPSASKSAKSRTIKTAKLSRRAGQNTKSGAKIANPGISVSVVSAIREVIGLQKYSDIDFISGKTLYGAKKVASRFSVPSGHENSLIIESLEDNMYIESIGLSGKYKVTKFGAEFIKAVDQQIKKAKVDKYNQNLFN